jgi:hypothetical protein
MHLPKCLAKSSRESEPTRTWRVKQLGWTQVLSEAPCGGVWCTMKEEESGQSRAAFPLCLLAGHPQSWQPLGLPTPPALTGVSSRVGSWGRKRRGGLGGGFMSSPKGLFLGRKLLYRGSRHVAKAKKMEQLVGQTHSHAGDIKA